MFSKQYTFNKVVRHLRQQGCRARTNVGCAYRGDNSTKCAAGCLIPDELYTSKMEGNGICHTSTNEQAMKLWNFFRWLGHDPKLVKQLQTIHDMHRIAEWEFSFECLALEHGLKVPE
ncbi:MAG: hypothetical protein JWO15_3544 [Sphingomonadales bacterium]|nr:hypothetical protein [Sphingomonadales bacterium]